MLSFIEFLNETKQSNSLTKADEFFNMLCESEQLDEGFKDTLKSWWNKAKTILSKPINAINKVLDKDKELIKKTEENLKTMKKSELASIYGMEFANSNIIDDLIDFISMLKDIALFRYKKLPWRTAISAVALLGYILFPKNIKAGTILFTAVNKGFVDPMNDGIDFIKHWNREILGKEINDVRAKIFLDAKVEEGRNRKVVSEHIKRCIQAGIEFCMYSSGKKLEHPHV